MKRFLVPAAVATLVVGCARPAIFGLQPNQPVEADSVPVEVASAPTVVVREIYRETPVVYVDTVYLEEEPVPAETVYVEEAYETYVYVPEPVPVFIHEPPHRRKPRWSREHEPRPSRPPRDGEKPRPPDERPRPEPKPRPDQPKTIVPEHPVKRTYAPVTDGRQKSPDKPTPPDQLVPPKRQAPAQSGNVPAAPVQLERPKQVPAPPPDKPVTPAFDEVQVQVGMNQARRK